MSRHLSPITRHGLVSQCMVFLAMSACLVRLQAQPIQETTRASKSTDATIRDCEAPSADRIWVVGDRGLILTTENGGRTWAPQDSRSESDLKGVAFDNEKIGWAVGGSIQPYSHRSVGVLLSTRDGGRNWTVIEVAELPHLEGIQSFGNGHLIVWGDWSPTLGTGLLESFDSGITWNPRMVAASHLQTCAWRDPQNGIVVDRLSRVFRFTANSQPELLGFAGDPTKPILAASIDESGWWLVGVSGQVFWSLDGRKWTQRSLPGNSRDHQLISIQNIEQEGEHTWLVGMPGNVIWHSDDRGLSWDTQTISTTLPMHCICAATPECLIVAGTLANIHETRNRGRGWWPIHSEGSRIALFNAATTVDHLAWDALGYMANETRHQAAAMVIHAQHVHERAGAFCDSERRTTGLANPIGLSFINICPQFPVGDLPVGRRDSDVAAYTRSNAEPSIVERQLALWIRSTRPDSLICDAAVPEDPLLLASSDAVRTARRLASDSAFRCFSSEAGIVEQAWNCKRVLARNAGLPIAIQRTNTRRSELDYAPTTAMKSTGRLLSEVLAPIIPTVDVYQENGGGLSVTNDPRLYSDYVSVHGSAIKSGKDHLLIDMTNGTETRRPALRSRHGNLHTMIASTHHSSLIARLLEMQGPDIQSDARWQASLKSFLRSTPAENHSDSLWQLAQGYRLQGYWNRWQFCLESLMAESPRSGVAELACLQALQFLGSDEVNLLRAKSLDSKQFADEIPAKQIQTTLITSPFSSAGQPVQKAASLERSPKSQDAEFRRLRAGLPIRFPMLQADPRFLVIDASFQRQQPTSVSASTHSHENPLHRLTGSLGLQGYPAIAIQELRLVNRPSSSIPRIERTPKASAETPFVIDKTDLRPRLDGALDDPLWQTSQAMPLENVWLEDHLAECTIRMTHDGEFLYIAAACSSEPKIGEQASRYRESLTLRIDTDRDYLTWFELQIDEDGNVAERCTDMDGWQPKWYFKTKSDENAWFFEAAIPIAELQAEPITSNSIWALAIQRSIPNRGVQMNRAMYSDRLLFTSARLVRFNHPTPGE